MKAFSVIIPAYNCGTALAKTLAALRRQTIPEDEIEAIVIDDASTDGTRELIDPFIRDGFVRYLRNEERLGSGVARNKGLDAASGTYVLLLDADNVPDTRCLEEHLDFHKKFPGPQVAVLGNSQFPDDAKIPPLMKLDDVGLAFRRIRHGDYCGWDRFSSMHISLKRSFVNIRFDEEVFARTIGFEDTDLGFRLHKKGLAIVYNSRAVSHHYHFRTPQEFLEKVYGYGSAFRLWLGSADRDLLKETGFINGYLPERGPKLSARYLKYVLQKAFINDLTIRPLLAFAKKLETINGAMSSFLYRRFYNHYFHNGFYGKAIH